MTTDNALIYITLCRVSCTCHFIIHITGNVKNKDESTLDFQIHKTQIRNFMRSRRSLKLKLFFLLKNIYFI